MVAPKTESAKQTSRTGFQEQINCFLDLGKVRKARMSWFTVYRQPHNKKTKQVCYSR